MTSPTNQLPTDKRPESSQRRWFFVIVWLVIIGLVAAIAIGLLLTRSRSTSDRHHTISKPEVIAPPRLKPNADGQCGKDVCPKLPSVQDKIPEEKHVVDRQRIIKDVNPKLPSNQDKKKSKQLVNKQRIPKDVCPNLPDVQDKIPEGKQLVNRQCIPKDVCPNLPGDQDKIPKDMRLDARLFCVWVDSDDSFIREMKRKQHFENDCLVNETTKTRCFLRCTSSESAKAKCIEKYGFVPQF